VLPELYEDFKLNYFNLNLKIWQVLAITIERHKAVSRPLEQRTRKGQFSLRSIFSCIVFGAFALNFLAVPFERALIDWLEKKRFL